MGRGRRRARRGAARRPRASTSAATTCGWSAATGRTCSPSPRRRSSTELSVTGRGAWTRLFDELTSAIRVDLAGRGRARSRSTSRSRRLSDPDRETRRADRRGGDRRARARAAHPRLRLQHPAPGQGDQGPAALLPALARRPQPLQRGLRRVGAGAGRGGPGPLRAGPALVRDQGAAARHRAARRLRPHGGGHRRRRGDPLGGRAASWSSTPSPPSPTGPREVVERFFDGALDRRPAERRRSAAAPSAPRPSPRSTPT